MTEIKVNGVTVGFIEGQTYFTHRDSRKHFFRKMQGYPISISVLETLKERGVEKIKITEHRKDASTRCYECSLNDFDFVEEFQEDGFDIQKCIPLRKMRMVS